MMGSGNLATQAPINIRTYNYFNLIKLYHTYLVIIIVILLKMIVMVNFLLDISKTPGSLAPTKGIPTSPPQAFIGRQAAIPIVLMVGPMSIYSISSAKIITNLF